MTESRHVAAPQHDQLTRDRRPAGESVTAVLRSWWGVCAAAAGLLVVYYALPVDAGDGLPAYGLLFTALGLGVLGGAIVVQVKRDLRGVGDARLGWLVMMLVLVLVLFALAYFILERARPGEIAQLSTRTDALYFTLSTLATVGFGDVHASGQIARALVSAQIVFNLVLVAALVQSITHRLRDRRGSAASGRPQV